MHNVVVNTANNDELVLTGILLNIDCPTHTSKEEKWLHKMETNKYLVIKAKQQQTICNNLPTLHMILISDIGIMPYIWWRRTW